MHQPPGQWSPYIVPIQRWSAIQVSLSCVLHVHVFHEINRMQTLFAVEF